MRRVSRRDLVVASASAVAGVAGCLGGRTIAPEDGAGNGGSDGTDGGGAGEPADGTDGEDTGPSDGGEIRWTYDVGASVATVHDGRLYAIEDFVGGSGGVLALEAASGDREWTYGETGGYTGFTSPVVDDAVYVGYGDDAVGSGAGRVHAIEADGTERWTANTGSVYHPPRLSEGVVCAGSDDGAVYGLDCEDGAERWSVPIEAGDRPADPTVEAVEDGTAYVTAAGAIRALDPASGDNRWTYETGDGRVSSVAIGDAVYAATYDRVHAADGGEELWTVDLDSNARIRGVVDGTVVVSRGYDLFAFDGADGSERWRLEAEAGRAVRAAVTDDGVYAGADPLRAIDPDGTERWTADLDGSAVGAVSAPDGSAYAVTDDAVHRIDRSGERVWTATVADVGSLVVGDGVVYVGRRDDVLAIDP